MRTLLEYINSKEEIIFSSHIINKSPIELNNREITTIADDLVNGEMHNRIINTIEDWLKDNPKQKNIECSFPVYAGLYMIDRKNKDLMAVIEELERIGVIGEWGHTYHNTKNDICGHISFGSESVKFTTQSYKLFSEGDYTYSVSRNEFDCRFKDSQYGNGYNHLSAEDMTILRKKLWNCMSKTKCDIVEDYTWDSRMKIKIPTFNIHFIPEYDKRKLKALYKELKEDKRLQGFASILDATNRGIADYYASKRSGDFTGD